MLFSQLPYLEVYVQNTWLVIPQRLVGLLENFIKYKQIHGSNVEKELYNKIEGVGKFIKRLFECRPTSFHEIRQLYSQKW